MAIDIKEFRERIKGKEIAKNELTIKAANLNNYIEERLKVYSNKQREQIYKGDIIYQSPIIKKLSSRISFNEFSEMVNEFGDNTIARNPSKEQKLNASYSLTRQKQISGNQQIEGSPSIIQSQQNQYTVQLKNRTVRSLYYKEEDEINSPKLTSQEQFIQIGHDLGYKNTKVISNMNGQTIRQRFGEILPSQMLVQQPFYDQYSQSANQMIQKQNIRRIFDNYTFKIEKKCQNSSQITSKEPQSPCIKFLDNYRVENKKQSLSQTFSNDLINSSFFKKDNTSFNKVLNIHTQQQKERITHCVTPREQRIFKDRLRFYNSQSRAKNDISNSETSYTKIDDFSQNNSIISQQNTILKLIDKPHQIEFRKRIASLIQNKGQKNSFSLNQSNPSVIIQQTPLTPRSLRFNVNQEYSEDYRIQKSLVHSPQISREQKFQSNSIKLSYLNLNEETQSPNIEIQSKIKENKGKGIIDPSKRKLNKFFIKQKQDKSLLINNINDSFNSQECNLSYSIKINPVNENSHNQSNPIPNQFVNTNSIHANLLLNSRKRIQTEQQNNYYLQNRTYNSNFNDS